MSIVRSTPNGQSPEHAEGFPVLLAEQVVKRDGHAAAADPLRIVTAIEMAFRAEIGAPYPDPLPTAIHERTEAIAAAVVQALNQEYGADQLDVETIQDEVERQLMAAGAFGWPNATSSTARRARSSATSAPSRWSTILASSSCASRSSSVMGR